MSSSPKPRFDPLAPVVRILVIDGHPCSTLASDLAGFPEQTRVTTLAHALEHTAAAGYPGTSDVVLINGAPHDAPTLDAVQTLRARGQRVLLHTPRSDELAVRAAMRYGAHGYITPRPAAGPRTAPSATDAAAWDLSDRELCVLRAVADGKSNAEVGELLGISALTVKSHLARIGAKLDTGDRAAMVARVLRAGLIT